MGDWRIWVYEKKAAKILILVQASLLSFCHLIVSSRSGCSSVSSSFPVVCAQFVFKTLTYLQILTNFQTYIHAFCNTDKELLFETLITYMLEHICVEQCNENDCFFLKRNAASTYFCRRHRQQHSKHYKNPKHCRHKYCVSSRYIHTSIMRQK